MESPFFIEVGYFQKSHHEERICGDVFLSRKIDGKQRVIGVLSDGMGHGVKANVLATLTSTMALNFTIEHKSPNAITEIIMNALPVCSQRKMSYATFTIVDIDLIREVTIIEYDNPQTIVISGKELFEPEWQCIVPEMKQANIKEILTCRFKPLKEDRIIFWSDGVTQSGLGTDEYPRGWGIEEATRFVHKVVTSDPQISADKLAAKVVNMAASIDGWKLKDDASCAVIYFRTPRKLLICTGPPYEETNDHLLASKLKYFDGKKIVCGATTANIIARELKLPISDSSTSLDPDLPPTSAMPGVDLVSEGILTLSKAFSILENYDEDSVPGKGPADIIVQHMANSDEITFLVGTRVNEAHQDPALPVELELRRTLIKRITKILEDKFLKEVNVQYI